MLPRRSGLADRRWLVPAGVPAPAAAVLALISSSVAVRTSRTPCGRRLPTTARSACRSAAAPAAGARSLAASAPAGWRGGGSYAGLDVDGYAYQDPAGRRVVLYLSDKPFPEASGAERLAGKDGP